MFQCVDFRSGTEHHPVYFILQKFPGMIQCILAHQFIGFQVSGAIEVL